MKEIPLQLPEEAVSQLNQRGLTLPPAKPLDEECCDRGCQPCIFDWYDQKLLVWAKCTLAAWPEGKVYVMSLLTDRFMSEEDLK